MIKTITTPIAATAMIAAALFSSCSKEEYDLENVSDEIEFSTSIGAPIAKIDASLTNLFDLSSMKGKFDVNSTQTEKILDVWQSNGHTGSRPGYLTINEDGSGVIDLQVMTAEDFEELNSLDITIDQNNLPSSSDFIEIDDMEKVFGNGNPIKEIDDFTIELDVHNETPFEFKLGIQFASGVKEFYMPLREITPDDGNSEIDIPSNMNGTKTESLTYTHISANTLKQASGIAVTYSFGADPGAGFQITTDQKLTVKLKVFASATVDLSKLD